MVQKSIFEKKFQNRKNKVFAKVWPHTNLYKCKKTHMFTKIISFVEPNFTNKQRLCVTNFYNKKDRLNVTQF